MNDSTFEKYKLVVDEWFVNGFNGTKAYQKYYPKASDETAKVEFSNILTIPNVSAYQKEKQDKAQLVLQTSHEALLRELRNWAFSDITETISLTPEQVKELPADIRRLINKFKHTKRNLTDKDGNVYETIDIIELWFVSKEKAMEMIHKHTGFYEADNKQKTTPIQILNVDPLSNDKDNDGPTED